MTEHGSHHSSSNQTDEPAQKHAQQVSTARNSAAMQRWMAESTREQPWNGLGRS